jgi:lipopolysaccharide biosynthesis glycosyltransferase
MSMLTIGIGFDERETLAYHVLCQSILSRATMPIRFIPIKLSMLGGIYDRKPDYRQSNEFSYSRFLLPYLCGYEGFSLYLDCDMLCRVDIADIYAKINILNFVSVVQHDYTPKDTTKYLGAVQYTYPRKNWSSVMFFNNALCQLRLTKYFVSNASGQDLHRFSWVADDRIGSLGKDWNHLVGEYEPNPDAKIVHFTNGLPTWYPGCEYAEEWRAEASKVNFVKDWQPTSGYGDGQREKSA